MPAGQHSRLNTLVPILIGIAAAIGLLAGYNMDFANSDTSLLKKTPIEGTAIKSADGRIEEILRFVETTYVDSIDSESMTLNLIDNMLEELDPHSSYITPDELGDHNDKMSGKYRGIGIEALSLNDTFVILRVKEDSDAHKQGLASGDAIIEVDGKNVAGAGMSLDSLKQLLSHPDKERVDIAYSPRGSRSEKLRQVSVEVADIPLSSADISFLIGDNIGYLKLMRFSGNTYEQFVESLDKMAAQSSPLHLILDLRNNPGGYLPEAIKVLSQLFEEKGKLLTYTEGLNREKREYRTTGKRFYNIDKVAVLIDRYSASGSEILAGALQDWDRGIVIGEKSYGKGLVQEIFPLKNGGALRLTVAKYYTPSGRLIQKSYGSETNVFDAEESELKTKLLRRPMESGNGIIPDQGVPQEYHESCFNYLYYVDHYILEKLRKTTNDLTDADFSPEEYEQYISSTYKESVENIPENCTKQLVKELALTSETIHLSDQAYIQRTNNEDASIAAAVAYLMDPKASLALLPNKD